MLDHHESQGIAAEQQPHGGDASATQVVSSIRRAADTLEDLLTVDFSAFRLNQARYAALQFIGQSSSQGCSQTKLAAGLGQSESSVSGLVSRMRADGLLYRLRTKHDQRKRLLMLSSRGQQLLTDCELSYARNTGNILSRFDSDWLEQLTGLLDVFVERLANMEAANEVENGIEEEQPIRSGELVRRSA
jgi:DNA-binding MarR family transcriptional regulator